LLFYPVGEKKSHRLYVCDHCKRYLKAVDQRVAGTAVDLIAEPILTWSLDRAAREKGYQ
jgi:FdhE protein